MEAISRETVKLVRAIKVVSKPSKSDVNEELVRLETKVVGVSFASRQDSVSNLWSNVTILLHEPENPYDPNAMGVYGFTSIGGNEIAVRKLGFLRKDMAKLVAKLRGMQDAPEEQKYNLAIVMSMGGATTRKGIQIILGFSPQIRDMFSGVSDDLKEVRVQIGTAKVDDEALEAASSSRVKY